ncbi:MFS transporter [Nocardiopsis coralliicola]
MARPPTPSPPPEPAASGAPEAPARSGAQNALIIVLLVGLVEITGLTYTMVSPALADIGSAFGSPDISWVVTVVTLVGAIAFAVGGKLGDVYGKKRVALACTALFAAGAAVCALAPSMAVLVAGRALQGAGLAVLALTYGMVRDALPARLVPVALGFIGTGMGASTIIGPVISSLLMEPFSFAGIFWFQCGYAAVLGLLVLRLVPECGMRSPVRVGWTGAALLGLGALAVLNGAGLAKSAGTGVVLAWVAAGAVLIAAWLAHERRARDPLVDVRLLARRGVGMPLLANAGVQFALVGNSMLLPMFVMSAPEGGFGFGASHGAVAVFLGASGASAMVAGPLSGLLSRRFGPRAGWVLGASALTAGALMIAFAHGTEAAVLASQLVFGVGIGAASASLPNAIVRGVPADVQGVSGGMLNLVGSLGSSLGSQVLVVLLLLPGANALSGGVQYAREGFVLAFLATAACGAVALLAAAAAGPLSPARDR